MTLTLSELLSSLDSISDGALPENKPYGTIRLNGFIIHDFDAKFEFNPGDVVHVGDRRYVLTQLDLV